MKVSARITVEDNTNNQGIAEEYLKYGFSVQCYVFPGYGWQDGRFGKSYELCEENLHWFGDSNHFDRTELSQWCKRLSTSF